jgi:hypothetical protein
MPSQHGLWPLSGRIPQLLREANLPSEALLEEMIVAAPNILSHEWMMIARTPDSAVAST